MGYSLEAVFSFDKKFEIISQLDDQREHLKFDGVDWGSDDLIDRYAVSRSIDSIPVQGWENYIDMCYVNWFFEQGLMHGVFEIWNQCDIAMTGKSYLCVGYLLSKFVYDGNVIVPIEFDKPVERIFCNLELGSFRFKYSDVSVNSEMIRYVFDKFPILFSESKNE